MPFQVYYLDDEEDLASIFAETFSDDEVKVTSFVDPAMALEAIRANPPGLFFVDYRLPRTTGDEVALQLAPGIPTALVTGDLGVKLRANFVAVFEKPFNLSEVRRFIREQAAKARPS